MEKVVLFFLSKQGELARLLLDARHPIAGGQLPHPALPPSQDRAPKTGGGGGEGFFIGGADSGEVGSTTAIAGGDVIGGGGAWLVSRETDRHEIYCSIGRQIAELMRFLRLNGGFFVLFFVVGGGGSVVIR